jgi:hypothetical protein
MKKLVLTIGLVVTTSLTAVAQKEFINNDKIINFILTGQYKKVKELTKLPSFETITVMDDSMIGALWYDSIHSTAIERDSVLIHYITEFHEIGISKFTCNPKQSNNITCKVTRYTNIDSNWVNPNYIRNLGPTIQHYNDCTYIIIKNNIKYTVIINFTNNKLTNISFFIFKQK